MALIALSRSEKQLLVAIARNTAGRLMLQDVLTVDLRQEELDEANPTDELRRAIKKALSSSGINRGEATVVLTREQLEMRQFAVPEVPDDELPDLVRFQSRNHFTSINENWRLDYVPIKSANNQLTVLAAAASPDQVQLMQDILEPCGLKLRHIVLRPFSAAELLRARLPSKQCRLVVEIIGRQADLSIVNDDYVVLTRTVRVPESYSDAQFNKWIPSEIRRTIASASNQTDAPDVEELVVLGSAKEKAELKEHLTDVLDLPVQFLNPFDAIPVSRKLKVPASSDGFASLLGSLVQQVSSNSHALDFLNPRKKPVPEGQRRRNWIIAGSVAAAVLVAWSICWLILNSRQNEIDDLRVQVADLNQQNVNADELIGRVSLVDQWKEGDINWLQEFDALTDRFLLPDDAIVDSFDGRVLPNNAMITLQGRVADQARNAELTRQLLTRPYEVEQKTISESKSKLYGWDYNKDLRIDLNDVSSVGRTQVNQPNEQAGEENEKQEDESNQVDEIDSDVAEPPKSSAADTTQVEDLDNQ